MAKLNYKMSVYEYSSDFQGDFDLSVKKSGKEATWDNAELGSKITIEGEKLVAASEGDYLESGKVTGLTFYNGDEKLLLDVSDLNLKAAKLSAIFLDDGLSAVLELVTKGDDIVQGTKKGGDYLYSGGGDDVLTGKGGSDTFAFQAYDTVESRKGGIEEDVITDFGTKGAEKDYFDIEQNYTFKGVHKQEDTLLTFDDGSTLLLEDVTKKEFQTYYDSLV